MIPLILPNQRFCFSYDVAAELDAVTQSWHLRGFDFDGVISGTPICSGLRAVNLWVRPRSQPSGQG